MVQAPILGKTDMIIAGETDKMRVKNFIRTGRFDVVQAEWLEDCLNAGRLLMLQRKHVIFATVKVGVVL